MNVIKPKKKKDSKQSYRIRWFYMRTLLNIYRTKPILLNLFPRWKKMEHSKIHPMRLQLSWYQNQTIITEREKYKPISLMNIHIKMSNKISANWIQKYTKRIISYGSSHIYSRDTGWFNICKPINVIYHINKMKSKIYMIITIDAQKNDRTPHPLMTETL